MTEVKKQTSFPGILAACLFLALSLLLQAGFGFLFQTLQIRAFDQTLWMLGLANLLSLGMPLALILFLIQKKERVESLQALSLQPVQGGKLGLLIAAMLLSTAGATVVLGEMGNWIQFVLPIPDDLAQVFNAFLSLQAPLPTLVLLMLVAPLTEETLFRGVLLRSFQSRYGAPAALLMTSALFGLFHLNPWQAPAAFLAGLYLGWLTLRTKSLYPALVVHSLFNGLPVILSLLGLKTLGYNTPSTATAVFQPLPWFLGGIVVLTFGLFLTIAALGPKESAEKAPFRG